MRFFISFAPATFWLVVGYFVLFSSTRAEGGIKTSGKVLAIWTSIIAAVIPVTGAYITIAGFCPV